MVTSIGMDTSLILVLDDAKNRLLNLANPLQGNGHEVDIAASREEAIRHTGHTTIRNSLDLDFALEMLIRLASHTVSNKIKKPAPEVL